MTELRELENDLSYKSVLKYVMAAHDLNIDQARWCFEQIMTGQFTDAQIAGLLVALKMKGQTITEYTGAAQAMRSFVTPVDTAGMDVLDTCGMGGTGISTFNISTATAFVATAAGVKVAKHGNRTFTRASGSANVLDSLGVKLDIDAEKTAQCLKEVGMCFCFAVNHHPAMKYAIPARQQLAVPTIFNVLGPLTNPAGAKRQLMGVSIPQYVSEMAGVLRELGCERAMIVHSSDGLDELSTTAPNMVAEIKDGKITEYTLDASKDLTLPPATLEDLHVSSPGESADVIRAVLKGENGPARDIVLLNAAAAIVVAGLAEDMTSALTLAAKAIDSGKAAEVLEKFAAFTNH